MDVPSIAHRQHGVFTRAQAAAEGFTRSAFRARVRNGRWVPVLGDVLRSRETTPTTAARAWTAHLVTGGVVSHELAAAVHGLVDDDGSLHVSSPVQLHVGIEGVREHRVRLAADDVVLSGGLPITSRVRTVVDLLATSPPELARSLLFRAVQQRWITAGQLDAQIAGRKFMTGTPQLRDLARLLGTGAHSVAELELHRILADLDGVRFAANVPVAVGTASFVVDVLIDGRVVIEVDGRRFHSDPEQFTHDRRRQNLLVGAGYVVLRFTWLDLMERPGRVKSDVLHAIAVSGGRRYGLTGP